MQKAVGCWEAKMGEDITGQSSDGTTISFWVSIIYSPQFSLAHSWAGRVELTFAHLHLGTSAVTLAGAMPRRWIPSAQNFQGRVTGTRKWQTSMHQALCSAAPLP